jgi:hypothetical protein
MMNSFNGSQIVDNGLLRAKVKAQKCYCKLYMVRPLLFTLHHNLGQSV